MSRTCPSLTTARVAPARGAYLMCAVMTPSRKASRSSLPFRPEFSVIGCGEMPEIAWYSGTTAPAMPQTATAALQAMSRVARQTPIMRTPLSVVTSSSSGGGSRTRLEEQLRAPEPRPDGDAHGPRADQGESERAVRKEADCPDARDTLLVRQVLSV